MANATPRRSAVERLRQMPEVFTITDLKEKFGWGATQARVFAARCSRNSLVVKAGVRTGVYYNLLVDPKGPAQHWQKAVAAIYDDAVILGASALYWHSWTTQIPRVQEVAVPRHGKRGVVEIEGVRVVERDREWYESIAQVLPPPGTSGLRLLPPGVALADSWTHDDVWAPDPDDVSPPGENDLLTVGVWLERFGMKRRDAENAIYRLRDLRWNSMPTAKEGCANKSQDGEADGHDPLDDDEGFEM